MAGRPPKYKNTTEPVVTTTVAKELDEAKEEKIEVKENEQRVYEKNDLIPCKSICNGLLLVEGVKSGILYRWADYGDIEDVEYQDLIYMIRARKPSVFKPRFIIQDENFIKQNNDINHLYNSLYSMKDLKEIILMSNAQMKKQIEALPDGAKSSLIGIASSMIERGLLDSVQKIKTLDEIYGTQLILTLSKV